MKFDMGSTTLQTLTQQTQGSSDDLGTLITRLIAAAAPLEGSFNGAGRAAFDSFKARADQITADLNSALGAILSTDRDGAIMSWNLGAEHLFGYSMFEVLGKPWTMLSPERSREESKGLLERLLAGDDIVGHETVVVNK